MEGLFLGKVVVVAIFEFHLDSPKASSFGFFGRYVLFEGF